MIKYRFIVMMMSPMCTFGQESASIIHFIFQKDGSRSDVDTNQIIIKVIGDTSAIRATYVDGCYVRFQASSDSILFNVQYLDWNCYIGSLTTQELSSLRGFDVEFFSRSFLLKKYAGSKSMRIRRRGLINGTGVSYRVNGHGSGNYELSRRYK